MNTIILNKCLLASFFICFIQDCYGDYNQSTNVYAYLEKDAVLPCLLAINNTNQRWLKESSILTTGRKINNTLLSHKRIYIDVNVKEKKYNLLIANVSEFDYGDYKCMIQDKLGVFTYKSKITLIRQDYHREAISTAADDISDDIVKKTSAETKDTNQREGNTTDGTHTTGFLRDYLYHMLLAVGLIVVLTLSVGSSFCINHKCKEKMSEQKNENKMQSNANNEPLQEHEIDEEVIYEMCSSEYESIDEGQIITNTCSGSVNLNSEASTHLQMEDQNLTLPVGPYLDVIGDIHYQQQENRVNGGIPNRHSTLTSLSETQRQDYETIFPTERTREVGILQFTRSTSNDLEDLAESFKVLFESKHSSLSSNSAHSSAGNDANSTQQDDYLNPYMPLKTNEMDYLESYSAPINRDGSEIILLKDKQD